MRKNYTFTDDKVNMCHKISRTQYQSEAHADEYRHIDDIVRRSMQVAHNVWLSSYCKSIIEDLRMGMHSKRVIL